MRLIVRPERKQTSPKPTLGTKSNASAWVGSSWRKRRGACNPSEQRPLSFARVDDLTRRAIFHRFPYALFFVASAEEISVVAAFHMARHPDALSLRLGPDA